ncbi:phosphomannomutase/phosphoglucomutase [Patescibacteria group bacterium]|nr:phosphomannomutase/phosphoglucomutase [Patescibacteria group bacterium]
MHINPNIFKAYDIRGVYDEDFDNDLAYKLGVAFAGMRRIEMNIEVGDALPQIVVCTDMRVSSPELKKSLIDGLVDGGVDVVDIGLASTPTFYFAVAHYNYSGGIMVSASHNPAKYNGFKLVRERATPVSGETGIMDLRDQILSDEIEVVSSKGVVSQKENILDEQVKYDLAYGDVSKIKPFKIVIDSSNAMGALYCDGLFKYLPQCKVERMFWELDGTFPNHEADPYKAENIKYLEDKVKEVGADLGIAIDGDGDRIFFVDNLGDAIEPGIIRAILSRIFLRDKPGAKICYDIRPGRITRDIIEENGGVPVVTRVGHSLIKEQAIREGAYFAGESSGHFFLNMGSEGCYEIPMIVILKILEELSVSNQTFAEYIVPLKKYIHSGEINSIVSDQDAKIIELKAIYSDGKQNDLDGITIEFEKYWFNVRKSNTESLLRLNLEASNKVVMEEKRDEILAIINS